MKQRILSLYDYFLICGVIACNVVYSALSGKVDAVGSIAGIAGVICVVLVAKGSIWNYLFGVINVSLYAYISWQSSLFGDAALNALYYLPMQFIGWWQWRRRGASVSGERSAECSGELADGAQPGLQPGAPDAPRVQDTRVKARRMSASRRILLAFACAALILASGFALKSEFVRQYFVDPQPFKDSATTILSIIAQALMAMAFVEQWFLWIITNIISVVMWCICVSRGDAHAEMMVIMWAFYLLNSLNGLRVWLKLSRASSSE